MSYSSENIQKVKDILKKRHSDAISLCNRRKAEVCEKVPGYTELYKVLLGTSDRITAGIMSKQMTPELLEEIRKENLLYRQKIQDLLVSHGYPPDYTDVKYTCSLCDDNGYRDIYMCSCMREALIEAGIESSGLANMIDKQTFDSFSIDYYDQKDRMYIEDNRRRLREFAENFKQTTKESWLLAGATGLGKTHLSTAVAGVVIRKGFDVIYDGVQEILGVYEEERFGRGDGEQHRRGRTVERLLECDLLIVDDLGTEITNQFTVSSLYNLLSNRINRGKSTIINTNLNQSEIRQRYTDRIASRLFGEFTPLLFRGTDIRAQKLMR